MAAGQFTASLYSSLLFYDQNTGVAEVHATDGVGGLNFIGRQRLRAGFTHVVPGVFGASGFSGVLCYDQGAGYGAFYDANGQGGWTLLSEYDDWRKSWTHILAGRFRKLPAPGVSGSESNPIYGVSLSDVFFYEGEDGYGETYILTDVHGAISCIATHPDLPANCTHVVSGDFIDDGDRTSIEDVFFCDGSSRAETYARDAGGGLTLQQTLSRSDFPTATHVVAGSFAGYGPSNLLCYDGSTGAAAFRDCAYSNWEPFESYNWAQNWDVVLGGNFWMADATDDRLFADGAWTDLFLYSRADGRGDFYLHEPSRATPIQTFAGYVSPRSNMPGAKIGFHVSSQVGAYAIDIYRLGLYEIPCGSVENLTAPAAYPIRRAAYKTGAQWPEAGSFVVPDSWPSGLYVGRIRPPSILPGNAGSLSIGYSARVNSPASFGLGGTLPVLDIPFVVRATPGRKQRILVAIADNTYEAYNFWGGRSVYGYASNDSWTWTAPGTSSFQDPRALHLSFLRGTIGIYPDYTNKWKRWELPFLQWLERHGIAADLCTESDLHLHTDILTGYRLLIVVGHSEYWSASMRERVHTFVENGGNVAILAGNVCYWQVRFEDGGDTMVCYKERDLDPAADSPLTLPTTTVNWFEDFVQRDDVLGGVNLGAVLDPAQNALEYAVERADHWVFAGTGLSAGDKFGLYSIGNLDGVTGPLGEHATFKIPRVSVLGSETDVWVGQPSQDFTRLAAVVDSTGNEIATMAIFSLKGAAANHGTVFTASTINWVLGLSQGGGNPMDIITRNVISRLG